MAKLVKAALDFPALNEVLRTFAASFPGAWADHPWGEHVTKVGKKIFTFNGSSDCSPVEAYLGVKLSDEQDHALSYPFATPSGYGLGAHGWVSCKFTAEHPAPPLDLLREWIDESYRNVALKKLIKELDAR
jgi:predicted DNA-binding protein (MmcQ/YjbR family)